MRRSGLSVALVGAGGMVGRELLRLLDERRFPLGELLLFGSGRAPGRASFRGRTLPIAPFSPRAAHRADLALLAVETPVARRIAPVLLAAGVRVIDESSAFRMDPKVPLVIPEINPGAVSQSHRLISGPNCTAAALLMGLYPLHKASPLQEVRVATYQAVSGAGRAAVEEFLAGLRAWNRRGRPVPPKALPCSLVLNVFPQVGEFLRDGSTEEEAKLAQESRKILGSPDLFVSSTTVRVPVLRGHSMAAWARTDRPIPVRRAKELFAAAPGLKLSEGRRPYPTPLDAAERWPVYVGRVRKSGPKELQLWIVGDNLLKGAALNTIQIAELLLRKGWLRPRA